MIFASFIFGIGEFFNSLQASAANPWSLKIYVAIYTLIFSLIFLILFKKDIFYNLINEYKSLSLRMHLLIIATTIMTYIVGVLIVRYAFRENSTLKNPTNAGVLTSVLSMSFIFTIIINELYNLYYKKPINLSLNKIVGCIFIIIGILIIVLFTSE